MPLTVEDINRASGPASSRGPMSPASKSNALPIIQDDKGHFTIPVEEELLTGSLPSPRAFLIQHDQAIQEINYEYRREMQLLVPWSFHIQDANDQAKACMAKCSNTTDSKGFGGSSCYPQLKYIASHMPESSSCGTVIRRFTVIYRECLVLSHSISTSYSKGNDESPSLRRGWNRRDHDLQDAVRTLGYRVASLRRISNKLDRVTFGPDTLSLFQQVAEPEFDASRVTASNVSESYWRNASPQSELSSEQADESQALLAYRDPYEFPAGFDNSASKLEGTTSSHYITQGYHYEDGSRLVAQTANVEKSGPRWSGLRRRLGFRKNRAGAIPPPEPLAYGTGTGTSSAGGWALPGLRPEGAQAQGTGPDGWALPEIHPEDSLSQTGRHSLGTGTDNPQIEGQVPSNAGAIGTSTSNSLGPDIELQSQAALPPITRLQEPVRLADPGQNNRAMTATRTAVIQPATSTPVPQTRFRKVLRIFTQMPCLFFVPSTMLFMAMSLVTGVIYSVLKDDTSGGFTIAAYILAIGAVGLGPGYTSHLGHCVCLDRMKRAL